MNRRKFLTSSGGVAGMVLAAQGATLITRVPGAFTGGPYNKLTPFGIYTAAAADYVNGVLALGGTFTQSEADAFNTFVNTLISQDIWNRLVEVYPLAGGFAGITVKLKRHPSASASLTNVGLVSGDYGVKGVTGNGSSKGLLTGLQANHFMTDAKMGMTAHVNNASALSAPGSSQTIMGFNNGTNMYRFEHLITSGNFSCIAGGNLINLSVLNPGVTNRILHAQRTSTTSLKSYVNGVNTFSSTTLVTDFGGGDQMALLARGNGSSLFNHFSGTLAYASFDYGTLSEPQILQYYNAIATLNTALGR